MTVIAEIGSGQLAELVKQIQAGNEVLLTQGDRPVARLVSTEKTRSAAVPLSFRSLKGHRVLTPDISQQEIADEMFPSA